jgi:hypothetical protein
MKTFFGNQGHITGHVERDFRYFFTKPFWNLAQDFNDGFGFGTGHNGYDTALSAFGRFIGQDRIQLPLRKGGLINRQL